MITPSPASIGLGMALIVRPRLCPGAALATLVTATATRVVTRVASTARRRRIRLLSQRGLCSASAGIPAPYQAAANGTPLKTHLWSRSCAAFRLARVDPFTGVVGGGLVAVGIVLWLLGRYYPGSGLEQVGLRSARELAESREALDAEDLDQMLAAHNERRR